MDDKDYVISLLNHQRDKIISFPSTDDEFWRIETLQIIEKYIGKDTDQYRLIAGHTFHPNLNAINKETDASQRKRGAQMIDSCIDYINSHGIKKPDPLPNIIYNNTVTSGNIYQDFSSDNSLGKQITNIKTPISPSSKPIMEKWGLWVAIIVGIITLLTSLKTCGVI